MTGMKRLHYAPRAQPSPLRQAKTHERDATYLIALIVPVIVALITRAIMVASVEPAAAQDRLMNAIVPIVQFIVSLSTLALVRHQVSVAVEQIEQAEHNEARVLRLADAVGELSRVSCWNRGEAS